MPEVQITPAQQRVLRDTLGTHDLPVRNLRRDLAKAVICVLALTGFSTLWNAAGLPVLSDQPTNRNTACAPR